MVYTGIGLIGGGIILGVSLARFFPHYDNYLGVYYHVANYADSFLMVGLPIIGAGIILTIPGLVIKSNAKKNIAEAVNIYNKSKYTSNAEIKLGFTGNGVGLSLKF